MIELKSSAQLTDRISDDDLKNVTGGRKAGGEQQDFGGSDRPPPAAVLVEKAIQWVKGLFS